MKMADIIHLNYQLLPLLERFDISLGFGDKTVQSVCDENNVNLDFFLEIVNSYHDPNYFPRQNLQTFPVKFIVNYLQKTHSYYLEKKIPLIEQYIKDLIDESRSDNKTNLKLVEQFFQEYKEELDNHIQREETKVQPYVLEVEEAFQKQALSENLWTEMNTYSIDDFEDEHDNMEDKLYDLKNIIIKYLPPIQNKDLCNNILFELFRLEADLNDHARIEDKVLVPKVRMMEKELLKIKANS
jgi:regulator of cell morphogenesis and NO signaling